MRDGGQRWMIWLSLPLLVVMLLAAALQSDPVGHVDERDTTLNIAHGGAQGHAPANTIPAFELALELGADVLEADLQVTADGSVVALHDATVDRTTDGSGTVAQMTLDEVKDLDVGYSFEASDGSHPYRGDGIEIPTLDELLTRFPDTPLILELKTDGGARIVEAVADVVRASGRDDVVVASFSLAFLERFRQLAPDVPTNMPEAELRTFYALHLVGLERWWPPPGEYLQVPEIHEGRRVVTPSFVAAARRRGAAVQVWTVNDARDMHRLLNIGVDGIMTDYPDRLRDVLAERESATATHAAPSAYPGLSVIHRLQDNASAATPVASAITFLGDEEFYLLLFPLLYWNVRRRLGIQIGVVLLLSAASNEILKLAFATPRPLFIDPSVNLRHETSFGLPSGHAQNAVAVWGFLAARLRRWWGWAAAAAVIVALGWSRLQLGAHFPHDTLAGWAVGAILLGAFLRLHRPAAQWLDARGPQSQVRVAFLAALGLVVVGVLARLALIGWHVPAEWIGIDVAEPPQSLHRVVSPAAALFGLGAGVAMVRRRGGFVTVGTPLQRAGRYVVGIAGVAAVWMGLGALFPDGFDPVALLYRAVRYALTGLWIGAGAPLLFVRLGLARAGSDLSRSGYPPV